LQTEICGTTYTSSFFFKFAGNSPPFAEFSFLNMPSNPYVDGWLAVVRQCAFGQYAGQSEYFSIEQNKTDEAFKSRR